MDMNVEKNRAYYARLDQDTLCDCVYCQNYRKQVKAAYPEVAEYLLHIGIDIEKPFETSPLEPENGYLTYCACQYIAFGACEDDYDHKIGDVVVRKAVSHPSTGMTDQHFVLDVAPIILKVCF